MYANMLALQASPNGSKKSQVNILPCKIHRNGPAKITKRFWSPATQEDGSKTAYFRGRKLRGRLIRLPKNYHGVAVKRTDRVMYKEPKKPQALPIQRVENDEDTNEAEEEPEPVQILTEDGNFDEITVWGHDRVPALDDSFVKGIGEWIVFAEAIHSTKMDCSQSLNPPCA